MLQSTSLSDGPHGALLCEQETPGDEQKPACVFSETPRVVTQTEVLMDGSPDKDVNAMGSAMWVCGCVALRQDVWRVT